MDSERAIAPKKQDGRRDPVLFLNEECLLHILEFAWGVPGLEDDTESVSGNASNEDNNDEEGDAEDFAFGSFMEKVRKELEAKEKIEKKRHMDELLGISQSEALAFYWRLASVSQNWRDLLQMAIVRLAPTLRVDFSEVPEWAADFCSEWLGRHAFSIKFVRCLDKETQGYTTAALRDCNTTNLLQAALVLCLPDDSRIQTGEESKSPQRMVQHSLAQECSNLEILALDLHITANGARCDQIIDQALFAHSKLWYLNVTVSIAEHVSSFQDPLLLNSLIQNLPSLTTLHVQSDHESLRAEDGSLITFRIASDSLKNLAVEDFCTNRVNLELDCPRLETFSFDLSCGLRGLLGDDPLGVIFSAKQKVTRSNVPETCLATLYGTNKATPFCLPFHRMMAIMAALPGAEE